MAFHINAYQLYVLNTMCAITETVIAAVDIGLSVDLFERARSGFVQC